MKTRIGILGLGGVGGYFGGLLAKAYAHSETIEIVFIARGATLEVLLQKGLRITTPQREIVVFPDLVSNDPTTIGKLDCLLCATKTYDIEESLATLKSCITDRTLILPLYNGVDATNRISALFPKNEVLQGCVYIISMIVSPGVIQKTGTYEKLFFGSTTANQSQLNELQAIFKKASIESYLVDNIEETVWEKYVFISSLATATSYLNKNIGQILDNEENKSLYLCLLTEIANVAFAKGLALPSAIVQQTVTKLEKTPPDATSSMHRDFMAGNKTELAALTAYVVEQGIQYGVKTPTYQMVLEGLLLR
jgi:2-dehydropantoate 2-reductase